MKAIFVGSNGLRAGWNLLIFTAVAAAVMTVLSFAARFVSAAILHGRHAGELVDAPIAETILALGAFAATAVMARVEGRSFGSYGLTDPLRLRRFATGLGWGFALLTLELAILAATGHMAIVFSGAGATAVFGFAVLWGYVFVLTGFAEEMLFRGYALVALTRGIGFWPAAIMLSIVFGALHGVNGGEAAIGEVSAGLIALVLCFAIARTGSLWWAIGFHAGWDYAESFVWGARDSGFVTPGALFNSEPVGASALSGGAVGPEGSLLVLLPIVLAAVIVATTTRGAANRAPALAHQTR